jgi:hypothetical protein
MRNLVFIICSPLAKLVSTVTGTASFILLPAEIVKLPDQGKAILAHLLRYWFDGMLD